MLILHVIDSFSPAAGGPPAAVRELIKATRAAGTGIEVVSLSNVCGIRLGIPKKEPGRAPVV